MITEHDAFTADEFHIAHSGLPCTVWHRAGRTLAGTEVPWLVPIRCDGDWLYITAANAGDMHTAADCPLALSGQPETSPAPLPPLAGPRDAEGFGPDGLDADGYDRAGYDAEGYNRDGYDEDGFDRGGYDENGYDEEGYDRYDVDAEGYNREGYDRDGYDRAGYDESGVNDDGYDRDGYYYSTCYHCDNRVREDDLTTTLSENEICERCRDYHYSYCDYCEGWYPDDDSYEHDHDDDCGCESPQQTFAIRNDGSEPLANDTRATVALGGGVISNEGLKAIYRYLREQDLYDLSYDVLEDGPLGNEWQTRQGNYTKRLSRHAATVHGNKLSQEVMSNVGNLARDHSTAVSVEIDVTRDLNQSPDNFYHESSCWWNDYYEGRCTLKTNGGFGLRSFAPGSSWDVTGRAWVMPLRLAGDRLVATFETMTPDAFVVFNGYGELSGYAGPRVMAHMAGWTYRKIGFRCEPMYINAGGYLVAPEELAAKYTDGHLNLDVHQHARLFETERERMLVNA